LKGEIEAIIITGNAAYTRLLVDWISERVKFIAPVIVYPGESEMLALANCALQILQKREEVSIYSASNYSLYRIELQKHTSFLNNIFC
jgi:butyrate kinase